MAIDTTKKRPASGAAKASPHKKPKYDGAKPSSSASSATSARVFKKPATPSKFKPKTGSKPGHTGGAGGAKKNFQNKFAGKPTADLNATANPFEKQDWNKFKKDKKDLKLKRKQGDNKDLFELTVDAKKVYEELRW